VGDLAHLTPLDARDRIEIHPQLIGMLQVVGPYRVGVQLETAEVGEPGERGGVTRHHLVGAPARGKAQRYHFDPGRARGRRAFLIEEFAGDAVGIAHQHVRPPAGTAQGSISHGEIVAHDIELGVSRLGKEHLAWIGDRDLVTIDHEQLVFVARAFGRFSARFRH
jgi:hypothetical protein